jgi:hypothetical protein
MQALSVELPDAAWLQSAPSGSFDFSSVRFAPLEFAQDDRVQKGVCSEIGLRKSKMRCVRTAGMKPKKYIP